MTTVPQIKAVIAGSGEILEPLQEQDDHAGDKHQSGPVMDLAGHIHATEDGRQPEKALAVQPESGEGEHDERQHVHPVEEPLAGGKPSNQMMRHYASPPSP